MTTMLSRMLVAAGVGVAAFAASPATARADHYYGGGYVGYRPAYYAPRCAPAPVVYPAPAYGYAYAAPIAYRPAPYVYSPVYYPRPVVYRSYAPAPYYRPYYGGSGFGFGFGYARGGYGGYGGYRGHGGHVSHYGGGFSFHGRQ